MQRVIAITFLAFASDAHAKKMMANHTSHAQDSMDKFVDTLVNALVDLAEKAWPLDHNELDETALAKTRPFQSLGIPSSRRLPFPVTRPLVFPFLSQDNLKISSFPSVLRDPHLSKVIPRAISSPNDKALRDYGNLLSQKESLVDALKDNIFKPEPVRGKLPTIAIIGRPNVGKSTLANRLAGEFREGAIVHDEPGVTRDRTYRMGDWLGYPFRIIDTGGLLFDENPKQLGYDEKFAVQIKEQAMIALSESDVAMHVVDGQQGATRFDREIADFMRKKSKIPTYLVVNKVESNSQASLEAGNFWSLGLGEPYPISAIHGEGVGDLLDVIIEQNKWQRFDQPEEKTAIDICFVGKPNVGKSSLFNRLNGDDRAIVSDIAGTTRDTIDSVIKVDGDKFKIIDTAGIRRKARVDFGVEFFMINRAFKAIERSDVVVFMLDATQKISEQDKQLASYISQAGRGCVIALNKWDLIPNKNPRSFNEAVKYVRWGLPELYWAKVVLTSAATGHKTGSVLKQVKAVNEQMNRRVTTSTMMMVLEDAFSWEPPISKGAKKWRIYYGSQTGINPPAFTIFGNDPKLITEPYKKYLTRKIRENLGFEGAPIRLFFRGKSENPYAKKKSKTYKEYTGTNFK